MKTTPHTPESHSTKEIGMKDLTTVRGLLWLEKRIENRIVASFGRPRFGECRGPPTDAFPMFHRVPAAFSPFVRCVDVHNYCWDRPVPPSIFCAPAIPGKQFDGNPDHTGVRVLLRCRGLGLRSETGFFN